MLYYLSLGANLGKRELTLNAAKQLIEQQIGTILRCSSLYYSDPWGFVSAHTFCNLCCSVETKLSPLDMLKATQSIEKQLGRKQKSQNGQYSDRTIDIDIIKAFDGKNEIVVETPELTIPHPLWQQRDFVLVPLKEITDI